MCHVEQLYKNVIPNWGKQNTNITCKPKINIYKLSNVIKIKNI